MKIVINTDGSKIGTSLSIDGEKVSNLTDINFSCYNSCYCGCVNGCCTCGPYFSYTVEDTEDAEIGMVVRETHFLADQYKMDKMATNTYIGEASIKAQSEFKVIATHSEIITKKQSKLFNK